MTPLTENHQPELHAKEAAFHDRWAQSTDVGGIRVREAFEAPTALENAFILREMGPLEGKRILDVGAGLGESSVYFALMGAQVTCTDVSPEMVEFAAQLARRHGVQMETLVTPGEHLCVPEDHYDFVYVANTIHHVADQRSLLRQIRAALRPGGKFFSMDPLCYNPVIEVYRRLATEVRTEDEAPLSFAHLNMAKEYFVNVGHREFWICSLALFLKYFLIDRVHPNQDRYWKRIFSERREGLWWWLPLSAIDRGLTRIPGVRRLAWNMVMWGEKPR
jgi:2-polyprenyl-3-methyl-5-hydroxy-6-metoxy-1,4-benzoquinol methylase